VDECKPLLGGEVRFLLPFVRKRLEPAVSTINGVRNPPSRYHSHCLFAHREPRYIILPLEPAVGTINAVRNTKKPCHLNLTCCQL